MRHMLNQIGWLELRLQHILHILVQISNKFRWSNTNQQHNEDVIHVSLHKLAYKS